MERMQPKRVVVTGLGTINALGHNVEDFWVALVEGCSGIRHLTKFDVSELPTQIASEVVNFDPSRYMDTKEAKRTDPYVHFAVAASRMALQDAKFSITEEEADRCGVLIGTGIGGMANIQEQAFTLFSKGPRKVSPFMIPSTICNIAAGTVAIEVGARGPNFGVVSACTSGAHAIGEAFNLLRFDNAEVMIAGGSEAAIQTLAFSGFCAMKAMSTHFNDTPELASRPFDAHRDGFIMGEGAGILVLETLEHAQKRGAKIYCELIEYAATCDAFHITRPDPSGRALVQCYENLLQKAHLNPHEVDYINVHGTSTYYNDLVETKAIKHVFGPHAYKLNISSIKSMLGHLLGAAGAVEAIATVKTLSTNTIPPTINYETQDPECDLNYTPNKAVTKPVHVAITNNLGFGGQNAALLFKKF
ncbi:MAG: beta-ketoacyl-ACP synthase II [Puniceicoccales bacterium]|jgi:3-oxoacyl-[acyl-carrier-protein] synthase II|nr:beta-ketoacyl-ACP synthase II [Puniceicoccales bacterium]